MTLLAHVLTRACVLLSFTCERIMLKHFKMAILYEGPTTINLVDVIRNHTGLLQESWPDYSNDSNLPNKDFDEILWVNTKIYRNK